MSVCDNVKTLHTMTDCPSPVMMGRGQKAGAVVLVWEVSRQSPSLMAKWKSLSLLSGKHYIYTCTCDLSLMLPT